MSHSSKEKRGVRFFISYNDLCNFDLENATTTFISNLIERGKKNYYLENKVKEVERSCFEISDKLDRLICLSCEMFDLLSHSSSVDHFEIEKLKFYHENGKKLTQEQVSMVKVAEAKEENFRAFLKKLFPEVNPEIFKLMTKYEE